MQTKLGNHISTQKGYAFKSKWYQTEGMPIVKVSDFTEDSIDISSLTHIPEEIAKDYTRYQLAKGDVVIQTVGSWANNPNSVVGKAIKTPSEANGALLNQNAVRLDPNEDLDKTFMFYLLRNSHFKNYIVGCAQGAASQASITLEAIRDYSFELPLPSTQHRIADILSAYDDLIENNTRRIRILEQMTQAIYQEWFGKVDKESLPKGWLQKFPDYVDFLEGPGLRRWQFRETGMPFLNIRTLIENDIDLSKVQFMDEEEAQSRYSHFFLEPFDHVVSSSGTLGRIATIQRHHLPLMLNTSIIRMRPKTKSVGKWQLRHFLKSKHFQEQILAHATGAAQPNYGPAHLKQMWIIAPPSEVGEKYEKTVEPFELLICGLTRKNTNLRKTRDLLLPRLVSGEIELR